MIILTKIHQYRNCCENLNAYFVLTVSIGLESTFSIKFYIEIENVYLVFFLLTSFDSRDRCKFGNKEIFSRVLKMHDKIEDNYI